MDNYVWKKVVKLATVFRRDFLQPFSFPKFKDNLGFKDIFNVVPSSKSDFVSDGWVETEMNWEMLVFKVFTLC